MITLETTQIKEREHFGSPVTLWKWRFISSNIKNPCFLDFLASTWKMHTHQCFQGGEDWNFHRHSSGRQRKWKSTSDVGGPLKRCKQQPWLSGSISLRGLCVLLSIAGQSFSPLRAEMIQRQPPNYAFHSDNAKPLQHTRAGPRRVGRDEEKNEIKPGGRYCVQLVSELGSKSNTSD